ncbi:MAG TPA: hypothetical protein VJ086_07270 [Rubrobacteraceae bacterium]|nr:hypothetical protein [Rubrobacteraceae bacterium]
MLVEREIFARPGVLCVFLFTLGILTSCGGPEDEGEQEDTEPA